MGMGTRPATHVLLIVVLALPCAVSQTSQGTATINDQFRLQWPVLSGRIAPMLSAAIGKLARKAYGPFHIGKVTGVTLKIAAHPGFRALTTRYISMNVPLTGSWKVECRFDYTLVFNLFGATIRLPGKGRLTLDRLRGGALVWIDWTDPSRPRVQRIVPWVNFDVDLAGSDPLLRLIARPVTWLLNRVLKAPLVGFIAYAIGKEFAPLVAGQPTVYGRAGALGAPGSASVTARVAETHRIISRDMLPHDTIAGTAYSSGTPLQGIPIGHSGQGDSAIWTGHYLTAEAFRYRETKDPAALAAAQRVMRGIDRLFAVPGGTGLLARYAAPAADPWARAFVASGKLYHQRTINGVTWIAGGKEFISRDQYTGVMMGMGFAHAFVNDPLVRALARKNVSLALDYLLGNHWIAYTPGPRLSTTFLMKIEQQLAFLQMGRIVDRGKYGPIYRRHAAMAPQMWFDLWVETFDPIGSYFKFNLDHANLLALMFFETDPQLHREYHRGLRVLRGAIGHHQNAWFNAIAMAVDPSSRPQLGAETRRIIELFAGRPRRSVTPDPAYLQGLQTVAYRSPLGGAVAYRTAVVVPPDKRPPEDFMWQRDPFRNWISNSPNHRHPGVDLVLPYWIARHLKVIP